MTATQHLDGAMFVLTLVASLGCGLIAGLFFAFSVLVMKALGRVPPSHGIATTQAINAAAISVVFLLALLGTAVLCAALAGCSIFRWHETFAGYLLAGSVIYLVGAIGLTAGYHVPRNEALDEVDPDAEDAAEHWNSYLAGWTAWNHVRLVAALAASATLGIALGVG